MSSITFDTLKFSERSDIATKSDVLDLKGATKTELLELKIDIIKWMVGLATVQLGLLIGILAKLT